MNNHTLPTGLNLLHEKSGVKSQYSDMVFFSSYQSGKQDTIGSGISDLVRFRLRKPEAQVLFFSFYSKEILQKFDEFGVLQLKGTVFIQLPCSKDTILDSAQNCTKPNKNNLWSAFSEKACTTLLKQLVSSIRHGGHFEFVNQVSFGLRLAVESMDIENHQKKEVKKCFEERYAAMQEYFKIPQIKDLIELGSIVQKSGDSFLNLTRNLSNDFKFISNDNEKEKYSELREAIFRIQNTIEELNKI